MNNKKMLSLIIPVYNDAQCIAPFYVEFKKLKQILASKNIDIELIFIDDGSTDDSLYCLQTIQKKETNVKLLKLSRNFGAVSASKSGILNATGDCVTIFPIDLQEPIDIIPQFLDQWLVGKKCILGARKNRQDPIITKLFSSLFYFLLRLLIVKNYPKQGIDILFFDKQLIPYFTKGNLSLNRAILAIYLGYNSDIIYYERKKRQVGTSGWSLIKKLMFSFDSILGFTSAPIRLFMMMGGLIAIGSILYGSWLIYNVFFGIKSSQPGYASLVVIITFSSSMIMIMLGFIGEYISRIYTAIIQKPDFVIEETFL